MIEASLNSTPLNLMLDTGTNKTILFENERTTQLGETGALAISPEIAFDGFAIKPPRLGWVGRDNIFVEMSVASEPNVPIDGIIGYDFFKNLTVKISPNPCAITVNPSINDQHKDENHVFPLVLKSNVPFTMADIEVTKGTETIRTLLLVDTGYISTLELVGPSSSSFSMIAPEEKVEFATINGIHTAIPTRIASLSYDSFRAENLDTMIVQENVAVSPKGDTNVPHGLIGINFLKNYEFIVDYTNEQLVIRD